MEDKIGSMQKLLMKTNIKTNKMHNLNSLIKIVFYKTNYIGNHAIYYCYFGYTQNGWKESNIFDYHWKFFWAIQ